MGYFKTVKLPDKYGADQDDEGGPLDINPFKMSLINKQKMNDKMVFHYNPTSWSDTRATEYESEEVSEWATDRPQYKKTGQRQVTMTLFFDDSTLEANMSSDIAGYNLSPSPKTYGQHWKESGKAERSKVFSAPPLNKGDFVGAAGQKSTFESINWLREHSMTIPDMEDQLNDDDIWPPILIFSGLRQDGTTFGNANPGQRMFECVLTQVDVTPILMERVNPWRPIRAEVSITLAAYVESPV